MPGATDNMACSLGTWPPVYTGARGDAGVVDLVANIGRALAEGLLALSHTNGALLMLPMPGRSHSGPLPPLSEAEAEIKRRLGRYVQALAGQIGERNLARVVAGLARVVIDLARTESQPRGTI